MSALYSYIISYLWCRMTEESWLVLIHRSLFGEYGSEKEENMCLMLL
jgi:hypothetical protein